METSIERLLRLVADYHNFCNNDCAEESTTQELDELSAEDLDYIAAASAVPQDGLEDTTI